MSNLQHLTLYIEIDDRSMPVDGTQLQNDVLSHLSKLQTFVFYISTSFLIDHAAIPLSNDDIQRTFTDVKFGPIGCGKNYVHEFEIAYHIFSLPFTFGRIHYIGNCLTDTIFQNVTFLCICDLTPFEHEFFLRLARCFPSLQNLVIWNGKAQSRDGARSDYDNNGLLGVVQYPHLRSLEFIRVHINYVEQMLNESKTRLPCLAELRIDYDHLTSVTNNFTRDATRLNCINVQDLLPYRLDLGDNENTNDPAIIAQSEDFHIYFPLLSGQPVVIE